MRVLLVTPYLPHARVGHGGGTAVREMVRHLARRHELMVAALVRPGEWELVDATAGELGCRIEPLPFLDAGAAGAARLRLTASRAAALIRSLSGPYPYYVEKYHRPDLVRRLLALAADFAPQAIQVEYLQSALLTRELYAWREARRRRGLPAPALLASTHELGSVPRERRAAREGNPLRAAALRHQAAAWRRLQRDATRWVDRSLCVTDDDRARLEADGGRACVTVPLGMDTDAIRPERAPIAPPRCLFVGSFDHGPNRTAAEFLVDSVWPALAQWCPDAELDVVGRGSDAFLARRGTLPPGVRAHGFVDSLTTFYRDCRLFVAPLPEGGGIKIKILEAMAHGIPVVTTPVGAEGIVTPDDRAAVIVPADAQFAAAVRDALADEEGCRERAARARRIMEDRFSWRAIVDRLSDLYEEAAREDRTSPAGGSSHHGG